jgi:hypothetical protein
VAVTGYDNILQHVQDCDVIENCDVIETQIGAVRNMRKHVASVVAQLERCDFETTVVFDDSSGDGGVIHFKQVCKYTHPKLSTSDTASKICKLVKRPALWMKAVVDRQVEVNNHYINDVFNNMLRLSETFQILAFKHKWVEVFRQLWVDTPTPCVIRYNQDFYILSKVQCRNSQGQKWFGDTSLLNEDEIVVRRVWTKDPGMKHFSSLLQSLLKDVLNLFLTFGNWVLKQKKIKLKKTTLFDEGDVLIGASLNEFGLSNLVDNIKLLDDYDQWFEVTNKLVPDCVRNPAPAIRPVPSRVGTTLGKGADLRRYENVEDIFEDEGKLSGIPPISLMNMNNPELTGANYNHLMYYVLQDCEKNIFLSKLQN